MTETEKKARPGQRDMSLLKAVASGEISPADLSRIIKERSDLKESQQQIYRKTRQLYTTNAIAEGTAKEIVLAFTGQPHSTQPYGRTTSAPVIENLVAKAELIVATNEIDLGKARGEESVKRVAKIISDLPKVEVPQILDYLSDSVKTKLLESGGLRKDIVSEIEKSMSKQGDRPNGGQKERSENGELRTTEDAIRKYNETRMDRQIDYVIRFTPEAKREMDAGLSGDNSVPGETKDYRRLARNLYLLKTPMASQPFIRGEAGPIAKSRYGKDTQHAGPEQCDVRIYYSVSGNTIVIKHVGPSLEH